MLPLADKLRPILTWLAPPKSRVLVGASGGPDSQVLIDVLARLRSDLQLDGLWVAGIDHGLRPAAAEELATARRLAEQHGLAFFTRRVQVERRGNLLSAARRARYQALTEIADEVHAQHIAVAHTATDQVESILINLTRGSGLCGAAGMRWRHGRIIRPLLGVSRERILAYLEERQIPYVLDPSNMDERRARAQLRASVLPALRRLNPRFEESFARFAAQARADDRHLTTAAARELARRLGPLESLALEDLDRLPRPVATRLLRGWLARHDLRASRRALLQLFALAKSGRVATALGGAILHSEGGRLWTASPAPYCRAFAVPGRLRLEELGVELVSELRERTPGSEPFAAAIDKSAATAVAFDADRLHLPLEVRSWRTGDRLAPYGMDGHTKVGDLFTNLKLPKALRAAWPLVVAGAEILWIAGLRRSSSAPVTPETSRLLLLRIEGALPWGPLGRLHTQIGNA